MLFFVLGVAPVRSQNDFCPIGELPKNSNCVAKSQQEIQREALEFIQSRWWFNPGVSSSSGFLGEVGERIGGSVGSLALGQTAHQAGDILEGLFLLVTLRPGQALHSLSNGLNPLGLANSVLSDVGACLKSPFCERGFFRPTIKVGMQNISQMSRSHNDHPVNPATAPLNPGKHIGIYQQTFNSVLNWGGQINFEKPLYLENVYDSRDQSEFMALERLHCAFSKLESRLSMAEDYFLFGYNCGGFVADALEIAGLNSPYLANCGVGQELRLSGPSREFKDLAKYQCDTKIDLVPQMLKKIELGQPLEKKEADALEENVYSPQFLIQAIVSGVRAKNISNLYFLSQSYMGSVLVDLLGDQDGVSLKKLLFSIQQRHKIIEGKIVSESEKKALSQEIRHREYRAEWQASDYARKELELIFRGLKNTEVRIVRANFDKVFETLQYYCRNWVDPDNFADSPCPFVEIDDPDEIANGVISGIRSFDFIYSVNYLLGVLKHNEYLRAWREYGNLPPSKEVSLVDIQKFLLDPYELYEDENQKKALASQEVKDSWRSLYGLLGDLTEDDEGKKLGALKLIQDSIKDGSFYVKLSILQFSDIRKKLLLRLEKTDPQVNLIVHTAYIAKVLDSLRMFERPSDLEKVWTDGVFRFLEWVGLFETLKLRSLIFKQNNLLLSDKFFEFIKMKFLNSPVSEIDAWQRVFRDFGRIGESLLTEPYVDVRDQIRVWIEMKINFLQTQGHFEVARSLQQLFDSNLPK